MSRIGNKPITVPEGVEATLDGQKITVKGPKGPFANKGPYSQSYGFPVVMYRCESWIKKNAEHQRIDTSELWCWRRLLRVPWTSGR